MKLEEIRDFLIRHGENELDVFIQSSMGQREKIHLSTHIFHTCMLQQNDLYKALEKMDIHYLNYDRSSYKPTLSIGFKTCMLCTSEIKSLIMKYQILR